MTRPFKIPEPERSILIKRYLDEGRNSVSADCQRYGVCESYIANLVRNLGLKRRTLKPAVTLRQQHDHRWKWAVERGSINV